MHLQQTLPIPVIGVVEPGARAAVHATRNRRVGVIATKATVASNAYTEAIRHIDAGITVFFTAAPRFVEIAEQGIRMAQGPIESYTSLASKVYIRPAFQEIAREYLEPLRRCNIDTLVLGCTHYPLLKALIGSIIGRDVTLISSAREVARDVAEILGRKGALAGVSKNSAEQISVESTSEQPTQEKQLRDDTKACEQGLSEQPSYKFFTTGNDIESFRNFGARVLRCELQSVEQINLS